MYKFEDDGWRVAKKRYMQDVVVNKNARMTGKRCQASRGK
jgi:hypothetical protein